MNPTACTAGLPSGEKGPYAEEVPVISLNIISRSLKRQLHHGTASHGHQNIEKTLIIHFSIWDVEIITKKGKSYWRRLNHLKLAKVGGQRVAES